MRCIEPFEREIHLRSAKASHESGGRLVGQHDAVAHEQIVDRVGARGTAHACGRRWRVPAHARMPPQSSS